MYICKIKSFDLFMEFKTVNCNISVDIRQQWNLQLVSSVISLGIASACVRYICLNKYIKLLKIWHSYLHY